MPSNIDPNRPPLRAANSATDASRLRGRTRQPRHTTATNGNLSLNQTSPGGVSNPAAWIRSASTSSIRKLKRSAAGGTHSPGGFVHTQSGSHLDAMVGPPGSHSDILIAKLDPTSPSLSPIRTRGISVEPIHRESRSVTLIDQEIEEEEALAKDSVMISSDEMDEDVVLDVLPSFEMYNTLHRHIPQGNVNPDIHDFPPSYGEASTHDGGLSTTRNSSSSTLNSGPVFQIPAVHVSSEMAPPTPPLETNNDNNLTSSNTQHFRISHSRSSSTIHDISSESDAVGIEDDLNDNENIFIDKLYTLPKMTAPVEIDIKVTKHASLPPLKPENESMLKEYTSGDTVHGYCLIENKSNQPIKFEMLYVTLEGYISVVDKQKGKRTVKRFLRMVDLSASWSYTNIELGTGLKYKSWGVDSDNTILGLHNDRILAPGVRHKKFFVFKFPNQLLDTTCKQELFSHCLLPPSLGVDKYKNHCKYAAIDVNNTLGCGHLASKGSPILTYDMAGNDLSVNYTVDARIVGKDPKTQKLSLMREREYNVRFIPFGFQSTLVGERGPLNQLKDLKALVEERLDVLKIIFQRLKDNKAIKNTDIHGTDLAGTIDDDTELNSDEILERKLHQLNLQNSGRSASVFEDIKKFEPEQNVVESELKYKVKGKSSSKIGLFSGFLSSSHSASSSTNSSTTSVSSLNSQTKKTDKSGIILMESTVPIGSLPYHSPGIIHKTNSLDNRTKYSQENWIRMAESLPDEQRTPLKNLKVNLSCLQSNNSIDHDPPEIQSVTTDLIVITAKSENSIPIKLNSELLLNSAKVSAMSSKFSDYINEIEEAYDKFIENKDKINELYNKNRTLANTVELKFSDFIPNQLYSNLESLANLTVKVDTMDLIFKKQLDTLKDKDNVTNGSSHASKYGHAKGSLGASSNSHSRNNFSNKYSTEVLGHWVKKGPAHYEREVTVNFEYTKNFVHTLVPNFESCICCRFYCVRVTIKFHHIGTCSIDIPITVKHFDP